MMKSILLLIGSLISAAFLGVSKNQGSLRVAETAGIAQAIAQEVSEIKIVSTDDVMLASQDITGCGGCIKGDKI